MTDTITLNGRTYYVRHEPDDCTGYPWDNEDGHGPVIRDIRPHWLREGSKRPGWRPLNIPDSNEYQFYYDWKEACRMARRDGWNAAPYDAPNRIQRAVQANFDYLRRFLAGDWMYIGVIVEDAETGESQSLWGVESNGDYPDQVARELAEELGARRQRETFPVSVIGV